MTVPTKPPDLDRPITMLHMILIHQAHERYTNELCNSGVDATQQLEEKAIIEEIYKRFLDLEFDQLLMADAGHPDSLTLRIASKSTEQEKLFKELRTKYLDYKFEATIH